MMVFEQLTYQDLLILAAKAADIGPVLCYERQRNCLRIGKRDGYRLWRPLTCSNDTLLLQATLEMTVSIEGQTARASMANGKHEASFASSDPISALRLVVLVVAAKRGKEIDQGMAA